MDTIVSPSLQTLQILALIAAIVFFIGFVLDMVQTPRRYPGAALFAGLCLVALALMFGI